ncbi:hypothetical protein KP509_38G065400 [Ceratopteris richardii]|uniref:F-box domain-containing protein n=1 Tax=Ceratopteris richardii TaxID=49495 RepID=A0A8T2Q5T3_CERRI|nr:hypothetical protein KP509_38G065400 [Ceratopteris richardii]
MDDGGPVLDDEELDNTLEKEFQRSQSPRTVGDTSSALLSNRSPCRSYSLTFSFPGWGVEIFRDRKRRRPSFIRDTVQEELTSKQENADAKTLGRGFADNPGNGCSIYQMPDELMINIFRRLSIKELSSCMCTCHWWQHLGSQDDIWKRFDMSNKTLTAFPRWGLVKYDALMKRLQSRHVLACGYFGQGFSHLRDALHVWWDTEKPSEPYGSKAIGSLLYKMAVSDWTMLYECLEVILSERVDCIAALLLKKVKEKAGKHSQPICPFGCDHQSRIKEDELLLDDNVPVFSDMLSSGAYGSDEVKSSVEALIGKSLWGTVCMYWKHYKQWLMLIFEHCGKLNMQVMVEKARSTAWTTTPNLYEKGVICFRKWMSVMILFPHNHSLRLKCDDAFLVGDHQAINLFILWKRVRRKFHPSKF